MKENKHIEKELLFKTNIKDIVSISLDSDFSIEDGSIKGEFLINGDYKTHELSMNRESFNFKIPFIDKLEDYIDPESIKLDITDFTYDYKNDVLLVKIEYEISGDKKTIIEFNNEETLEEFLSNKEVDVIDTRIDEIKENLDREESSDEIQSDILNINDLSENKDKIVPKDIVNKINSDNNEFVTYKIYKMTENESLESIIIKYHTSIDELTDFNEINNIKVGDKIIIPYHE